MTARVIARQSQTEECHQFGGSRVQAQQQIEEKKDTQTDTTKKKKKKIHKLTQGMKHTICMQLQDEETQ